MSEATIITVSAVDNGTGPTHLIAATAPTRRSLFGPDDDLALCAPYGLVMAIL